MWIVKLALNRPYTFVVLSLLIVILSGVAIVQTPVDIFPDINIPVIGVILNYGGLSPQDMQDRLATVLERNLTTTVSDIEHMEAQSYHGVAVIKIFFQPGTDVFAGMAQVSATAASAVRGMPPGTLPPFMIAYSAADVPILQIGLSSKTLSEQQLQDLAGNFIRTQLATIQGAELPAAYGGKNPLITVDLDPQKLLQRSISGAEVVNAVNAENLVAPQGTEKIGSREYDITLNSSAKTVDELNDLPVKVVNGAVIYLRDVAYVHNGASFQTNIARNEGQRGVLQTVPEAWQGLHAGRGCQGTRCSAENRRHTPTRPDHHASGGSIDLRPRGGNQCSARDSYCCSPDGVVDSAVSRQLAQHAGGLHFHPAVDSHLASDNECAG